MDTKNWVLPSTIPEQQRKAIIRLLAAILSAVEPELAVKRCLRVENNFLCVKRKRIPIFNNTRIFVIAIGKAAVSMSQGADRALGEQIYKGIIIPKHFPDTQTLPEKYVIQPGSHPEPNEKSQQAAIAVLSLLEQASADDIVIFLISGGGSALLSLPENPLMIDDLKSVTHNLLASGASIQEMNVVRKKLDQVKGGKLALAAFPARIVSLVISDVVDNDLGSIASGPTVQDETTFLDAKMVLEKYQLWDSSPSRVKSFLINAISAKEMLNESVYNTVFRNAYTTIIASNHTAIKAAGKKARELGYNVSLQPEPLIGEASAAGIELTAIARQAYDRFISMSQPQCVVLGGETTVKVKGNGLGGRNLEVALSSVTGISNIPNVSVLTLATDGEDGPTDAAGAFVTNTTYHEALRQNMGINEILQNNDAYHALERLGGLLKIGPTGTNVNDISFIFCDSNT